MWSTYFVFVPKDLSLPQFNINQPIIWLINLIINHFNTYNKSPYANGRKYAFNGSFSQLNCFPLEIDVQRLEKTSKSQKFLVLFGIESCHCDLLREYPPEQPTSIRLRYHPNSTIQHPPDTTVVSDASNDRFVLLLVR